jgi:hypothetical protein
VSAAASAPAVVALDCAGDAEAWRAAGFALDGDSMWIGGVCVRVGVGERGIAAWTLCGIAPTQAIDGLPTRIAQPGEPVQFSHPNGAVRIDHLVIWSGDSQRTVAALEAAGLRALRVREDARPGFRQTFFRAGEVIVELVAPAEPDAAGGRGPARFFGIACTVDDLDACAARLGEVLGPVKDAVQPGRRIATLRGRLVGLDVAVALMSP